MSPEDRFAEIVAEMADIPGVTPPSVGSGFGSSTLRFDKKIFAMLANDRLVVKLPKARVDALVDAGEGVRFDGNKGKPMKEWFSVDPGSQLEWRSLTDEALDFVRRRADG
jgi:TfoX/Sxy family transcriptional regulator of competence genes